MHAREDYLEINRKTWDAKTPLHVASDFYDVERFIAGKTSLNKIELNLLGDVRGKKILHLQCHFGQDSIALSRMGAEVTGVDFSETAINEAKKLAKKCGTDTAFICSDVYALNDVLRDTFDIVFTSYGTIGWLPDLQPWAKIISSFLKQNGRFVFAEFHPFVWLFDDSFNNIIYSYFNTEPILETETGSYANRKSEATFKSITWNHPLSDVFKALMTNNLSLEKFQEFDYSPYPCFNNVVEEESGVFRIANFNSKIPLVYALVAIKTKIS